MSTEVLNANQALLVLSLMKEFYSGPKKIRVLDAAGKKLFQQLAMHANQRILMTRGPSCWGRLVLRNKHSGSLYRVGPYWLAWVKLESTEEDFDMHWHYRKVRKHFTAEPMNACAFRWEHMQ
jgi:hypothetical protein